MKKIIVLLLAAMAVFTSQAIEITKVDKATPTDEIFMDMAVSAAKKSLASNNIPSGAVIILNGAWRSAGTPEGGKTPEAMAVSKSRLSTLRNAVVYTVNEPTVEALNLLNSLGVEAVYFANPRDAVIAAGIYPSSAYDESAIDKSLKQAPVYLIVFPEATALLK